MTPRQGVLLALGASTPVVLWALGNLLSNWPGEPATPILATACRTLWLTLGIVLAATLPLLLRPREAGPQLAAVLWLVTVPAPLYAMAVLAGAVSWRAAAVAVTASAVLGAVTALALIIALRRLGGGPWEHPLRLITAWGLALALWKGQGPWLEPLTRL